ncbi:ABC transporter ATP-binding protein [Shinella sp.]|uniref:ABC transporter ATP-binding protein n=1 Tax=Shinella sp. TaxID=1870904 RepID=UPI003F6EE1C7
MGNLVVTDLHVSFGAFKILKGVSLEVGRGEVVVLLGPSGSGKTTLLRAIAGLEAPQLGSIRIDEKVLFHGERRLEVPAEKRDLGLVFQSYALWPHRSVFDNVAYGLKLRGVEKQEIATRTHDALKELGLSGLAERFPHQLSGGQQQRVAIARALVYKPPVLLLDEPLSNLDAKLRDEAKAWLRSLIVDLQLSAVMVTHDQAEAMALADRIILLSDGNVVQEDTPVGIYNNPANIFSAEFFGTNNRILGTVVEILEGGRTRIRCEASDIELVGETRGNYRVGSAVVAVVRAERIQVAGPGSGPNRFPLPLAHSMFGGSRWEHFFRFGPSLLRIYGERQISGNDHWLEIQPEHLWIFDAPEAAS